jgi:hypothetical protein
MAHTSRTAGIDSALWSRRRLLQVGGIGLLGLRLPEFLQARAPLAGRPQRGAAEACIFVVQYGGCSHLDTFDLKPDAPEDIRGPYKPIATPLPGIRISAMLPRLATLACRYCLVRSMTHSDSDHNGGMHVCMTGHSRPAESTPYYGSVLAKVRPAPRNVPSYVWLQNLAGDVQPRYLHGGSLGAAYAPLRVGVDMDNPAAPHFRMTAFDPPPEVPPGRLDSRHRLLASLEASPSPVAQTPSSQALHRYQERAVDLVTGPEARRAFDLGREPDGLRDRYGRHPLGQNLLLARRLIEAGVRLVSVNAWPGIASGDKFLATQGWDMHGAAVQKCGIFSDGTFGLGFALPRFDQAVAALLEDLELRGLLASTLVVVVGEFGRTPKVVNAPYPGRDHWPQCYTALLAGGGVRSGAVYGASDRIGAYVRDNPVSPEDLGATLFHALGVPPETRLGADGFTLPASTGRPIVDLIA